MVPIQGIFLIKNSIHADGWTETLAGLHYLINQLEHAENKEDNGNKAYLTRLTIISSSYLAEQVFAQASKKYVDELLADDPKNNTSQLSIKGVKSPVDF